MDERVIRLRRPPVLVEVEGRFVPSGVSLDEVDARWAALCSANPRYFDGAVLQVLGVSRNGHGGVQIHVQECSYRFYAVQRSIDGRPGLDCGVRPLGVKAVTSDGARVLVGRRSASVAYYPSMWEFVPGGSLEPGVAPSDAVVRELAEEAGLEPSAPPVAVALLADPHAFTWEVVHRLAIASGATARCGWEYDEFRMVTPEQLPSPLAPVARQMMPLARRVHTSGTVTGTEPGE